MKKVLGILFVVLIAPIVAQAQWGWSPAERLIDQNLAFVDSMRARAYGYRGPAYYMSGGNGGYYGQSYGQPYDPPMGDSGMIRVPCECPRISNAKRVTQTLLAAGIAGGLGYGISGSGRGALRGAVIGASINGVKILYDSYRNQCYKLVPAADMAPVPQQPAQQPAEYQPAQQSSPPSPRPISEITMLMKNNSGTMVLVYDGDQYIGHIPAREFRRVPIPQVGYRAKMLVPDRDGLTSPIEAKIIPNDTLDGWLVKPPKEEGK